MNNEPNTTSEATHAEYNKELARRVLADKMKHLKIMRKPIDRFIFLTRSFMLREAVKHPTNGWKTYRLKNLAPQLSTLEFDFKDLLVRVNKTHNEKVYCDRKNPMVGI